MGKQIKSSGLTLDSSEMGSAPVSPAGTIRLRPKSDSSVLQVSYSGAAYVDLTGSGSTPRLDQVLDPTANKAFAMGNNQLAFQFTGADAEDSFVLESAVNAAGSGVVALIRTQGTTSTKAPLRVDANGTVALTVDTAGNVGVRSYDSSVDFNVAGVSQFTAGTGETVGAAVFIERVSNVANGLPALYVSNTQGGTQSGATNYKGVLFESDLQFTSTGLSTRALESDILESPATTNRTLYNITAWLNEDTNDITGSYTAFFSEGKITASSTHTGFWRGFYAQNPGATWAAKYGFVAQSGLTSGFGTSTPTATLHASGTVRFDLGSDATGDIFYRSSGGNISRLAASTNGFVLTLASGIPSWAAAAGGSTPRLDQVLDPNTDKAFSMGTNQLSFQFAGSQAEDCMAVESASNAAGSGVVLLVRTQGTTSTKAPLRVDANGAVALTVDTAGNVGVRSYDSSVDFNVAGISQFTAGTGETTGAAVFIQRTSNVANGLRALYVSNTQSGTQSGATNYKGVLFEHDLQFTSTGLSTRALESDILESPATTNRTLYNITAWLDEDTNDVTGSYTAFFSEGKITASATHTGFWRGFYAQNPGATWAAKYGFIA